MRWRTLRLTVLCVLSVVGLLAARAEACPACAAMIAERTSSLGAPLAVAFYWSILVLLAVPFALTAGMTWLLIRAVRRRATMEMKGHGA